MSVPVLTQREIASAVEHALGPGRAEDPAVEVAARNRYFDLKPILDRYRRGRE